MNGCFPSNGLEANVDVFHLLQGPACRTTMQLAREKWTNPNCNLTKGKLATYFPDQLIPVPII